MKSYKKYIVLFLFSSLVVFVHFKLNKLNKSNLKIKFDINNEIKDVQAVKDIKTRIESYKIKYKIGNISACIFYGRKMYTEILFRYSDSNLKINGGILDKILILNHLQSEKVNMTMEIDFSNNYLSNHREGYEVIEFKSRASFRRFYSGLPDDDLIFKIDDDIVFIANGTFERMIDEYFTNDHFILSANDINHHTFSVMHANMDLMQIL
jgi:hypothetical protein